MVAELVVFAPLAVEALAVRTRDPRIRVVSTGMGPRRATRAARRPEPLAARAIAVAGFCGALDASLSPGDVLVAEEVRGPCRARCDAGALPPILTALGLTVHVGPLVSTDHIVVGAERRALAASGARAVDMEAAWLAPADGRRFVVLRAVVDTPEHGFDAPWRLLSGGFRAYRSLISIGRALERWVAQGLP